MAAALIPLFPLEAVVFPRTVLPLHIFEERYKKMVTEAIAGASEFGVVLAKANGIANAGCTVTVEKLAYTYADGRMDILTRGQRRFEIVSLSEERAWLEGEVAFFDDEDFAPPPEELRREAIGYYRALRACAASDAHAEPDMADRQLSFQLAQGLPDLDLMGALLRLRSEAERLRELNRYLAEYVPRQRAIERMRGLAPTNGSGLKPAGV